MAITVNEGGTLYELDEVWSNEGGTLYEQDTVHSNEGGTMCEIHSATKFPTELTWDGENKSNFSTADNGFSAVMARANVSDSVTGLACAEFTIKGNVTMNVTFAMNATSGHWALTGPVEVANTTVTNMTVDLTTGDYSIYFGAGGGSQTESNYYGYASIKIAFSKKT